MKKIIILTILIALSAFQACKEDPIGQTPVDNTAPGKIINPQAQPIPGGARISYELPGDDDLLYVKAVYHLHGEEKNTAVSIYTGALEVTGFGDTGKQTVQLYCVDRSGNHSQPENVEFYPETPPVVLIRQTLTIEEAFGGICLRWKNEYRSNIEIHISASDSLGKMEEIDVAYSAMTDGVYTVRGMDPVKRKFEAFVRDRFQNASEHLAAELTPWYEEKLDKKRWERKILIGDNETSSGFGGWYHINNDIYETDDIWETETGKSPILFTIDLGISAKLSRYSLWHRGNNEWEYRHHNPKRWKMYGTNAIAPTTDPNYWTATENGWKNDWILLADSYSFKPSGENMTITPEDRNYAHEGFQFDMPLDAPPVRYIRFHVTETWDNGNMLHISELTFWGKPE
jgi:hypothetical protein